MEGNGRPGLAAADIGANALLIKSVSHSRAAFFYMGSFSAFSMQKVAQGVDMVMSQLLPCFATEREFTEEYFVVDQMTREAEREQKQSGAKVPVCCCNNIAVFFWFCMKRISIVADIVLRPATGCVSHMLLNDEADGRRLKGCGGAFQSRTKK
jgi:hypothetical protein